MFIKIKNTSINFDNVANFWFQRKKEEWHKSGETETKHRYFIHLEYLGYKHEDVFEFETEEELLAVEKVLDHLLKIENIQFQDEQ